MLADPDYRISLAQAKFTYYTEDRRPRFVGESLWHLANEQLNENCRKFYQKTKYEYPSRGRVRHQSIDDAVWSTVREVLLDENRMWDAVNRRSSEDVKVRETLEVSLTACICVFRRREIKSEDS